MPPKEEVPKVQPQNDLETKIMEAFEVFDHSGKQVVDVREVGTILRSLGCCPTEAEVQEVILSTENKEATGTVPLFNFMPYMSKAMTAHRFYPASADVLLAAFRYFDKEGRGYLTKERFAALMLEEGEPFTQEEFDEMMQIALDPVTDTIAYEYYINQLIILGVSPALTSSACLQSHYIDVALQGHADQTRLRNALVAASAGRHQHI